MARPCVEQMADLSYALTSRTPFWLQRCIESWRKIDALRQLMFLMAGLYLASLVVLFHVGLRPAIPWAFAVVVPIVLVPFAVIFLIYSKHQLHYMLHITAAMWILVMYHVVLLWPIMALMLFLSRALAKIRFEWKLLLHGLFTTILGYAFLWNVNYLLARFVSAVHDPVLRATDEWIYSWFLTSVSYSQFFPIVHNEFLLLVLNNAYMVPFPEVMLLLLLVCQTGEAKRVCRFLRGLFALYAIGVLCFIIFPAIGPCLYYPGSLDAMRANVQIVQGMLHDYQASAVTGEPLMGYGYFIAVPSLHVMVALYLQRCLSTFPNLYAVFLPVNLMLIVSTVVLGYHYIVDALIAVFLMGAWALLHKSFRI